MLELLPCYNGNIYSLIKRIFCSLLTQDSFTCFADSTMVNKDAKRTVLTGIILSEGVYNHIKAHFEQTDSVEIGQQRRTRQSRNILKRQLNRKHCLKICTSSFVQVLKSIYEKLEAGNPKMPDSFQITGFNAAFKRDHTKNN